MNVWTEIKITVKADDAEAAEAIAGEAALGGIYIEDYRNLEQEVEQIAHIDLIDEELLAADRSKAVIHAYLEPEVNPAETVKSFAERFKAAGIDCETELLDCAEEDWRNNWKKYFEPLPVGERLLIRPSWRDDYDPCGRVVLSIDPGLAFGTGGHETTRLCLEMCEKYMKPGSRVLDVGCGSGILGIAALLLGAKSCTAADIDETAVKTAAENAEINGVSKGFESLCGSFTEKASGKYDFVFANIVADAVMTLSESVADFMNPGAVYVMSGIIDSRADEVRESVSSRFEITDEKLEGGWACFAAKAKGELHNA